ncbi:MAG TPA: cytochrome c biogenesis protein CcsA [Planctomycetota bacterium]|nr:cytochrome c biogenesis protein CcsA [Planctomycetota bacterium]
MKKLWQFLGSYGLCCVLLGLLFLLTFLGTIEQTERGLYDVQKKYFESLWLVYWAGGKVPIPLPGVASILAVLTANLIVGGLIRIRKSKATVGVIIVHVGILIMFGAALVKMKFSEDGHLTLFERERSDDFESYYDWEVAIFDATQTRNVRELTIPQEDFQDLGGARSRTFTSDELPFRLTLSRFQRNSFAMPARAPMRKANLPLVDGWALEPAPTAPEAEQNVAGLYVHVEDREGQAPPQDGILWGGERDPLVVSVGGREWALDLRKKRYKMPFTIVLDKFTHEEHPRTGIARVFMSEVTKVEDGVPQRVRIEMNQPLRHRGLVLFQASWGPSNARPGDPLFSTFAVVRNPSDQWPLISCIVIALGMLIACVQKLAKYMKAQAYKQAQKASGASPASSSRGVSSKAAAAVAALAVIAGAAAPARAETPTGPSRAQPWDPEVVEIAASIPVQEGGRIKPLDTLAGFKLLKFNGRRGTRTPGGEALSPVPWLLDCLFYPEDARRYECFLVQNDEVLDAMGVTHDAKGKRARYSYADLKPGLPRLYELAERYAAKPDAERTPVEGQIVQLAHNAREFEELTTFLDWSRVDYPLRASGGLEKIFREGDRGLAPVVEKAKPIVALLEMLRGLSDADPQTKANKERELSGLNRLLDAVEPAAMRYQALALFPPPGTPAERKEWLSPSDLVAAAFQTDLPLDSQIARLADLEALDHLKTDPAAFKAKLSDLASGLRGLADARGEYAKIPLEVSFYKADFFYRALLLYVLGFVLVAISWMRAEGRWLALGVKGLVFVATALVVAGITMRCIIRSRPPVSTLYETILFITAVAVVVSAVIEYLTKAKIALALSTILGMMGMFLAMKYEFKESVSAGDTMPSLVAVLDTNFWLATHVTAVTTGYSAGLLASAIAHVYLIARILGLKKGEESFFKDTARMTYGVLLFGLLFSVVGTILGGIWANYSWGRFWGWDPKENGALLICLWELIILHARLGGYIRDFGLAVMSVLGGIVIAFSWWGVNLLGVGLHSYGFTSGVFQVLMGFYAAELLLVIVAGLWWAMAPPKASPETWSEAARA